MTSSRNLSDDLSYIRDLAEAGENAPLLGGRFLALWGGLISAAYLGHYLIVSGTLGLPPSAFFVLWVGFAVIGGLGHVLLVRSMGDRPGQASAGNRVQSVLWLTAGLFMFTYFTSLIIRMLMTSTGIEGFYWSVPMVLGLYGIGQFVTGAISGQTPLRLAGFAAFAGVVASVFLTGTEYIWLVGSISAFAAVFLPGLMMMRTEPSETV